MQLEVPPGEQIAFTLPEGATVQTLLEAIGHRFGEQFPPNVWFKETNRFGPGVQLLLNGRRVTDALETPLADGDELSAVLPIAGGIR